MVVNGGQLCESFCILLCECSVFVESTSAAGLDQEIEISVVTSPCFSKLSHAQLREQ